MSLAVGELKVISPEVCLLLSYWHSLGGGKSIPDKELLDLRKLTSIMPWMFILEMSDDGALTYRLAGSSLESAVGRGMAGEAYSTILSRLSYAAILEELYGVALVQGCGLLRTGSFTLASESTVDLEVLVLPFNDTRAMGSSIFVGVVKPFDVHNESFADRWGKQEEQLEHLLAIPSPRLLETQTLSTRVIDYMGETEVDFRVLDVDMLLEINDKGLLGEYTEIPSFKMADVAEGYTPNIN